MRSKLVLVVATLALSRHSAAAENKLREVSWATLRDRGALAAGLAVLPDGNLTIEAVRGEAYQVSLVEIDHPGVTQNRYVLRGRIRYRDVDGAGFLEMWSIFEDGSRYFTRTLGEAGPLQKISGSSDWRELGLFFDATGASAPLAKLTVGIVLPRGGAVTISDLTLVELDARAAPFGEGRWAAVAGGTLGLAGALLGSLAGAGRARSFVLAALKTLAAAGIVGLVAGVVVMLRGERYGTYYPLLLLSAIALGVSALALPGVRKRYEELELRRMRALDS